MLKYFAVSGFKSINTQIELDLSNVHDYKFNTNNILDNILKNIIIYGKNAVGKTNFGLALFDITTHLADKNVSPHLYDYYLNSDNKNKYAKFVYKFQFESTEVEYVYRKTDVHELLSETVLVDGKQIFTYDFSTKQGDFTQLAIIAPTLNLSFNDNKMSILRYLVNNTILDPMHPLRQTIDFVENMLWFRSLDENRYIGYTKNSSDYFTFIFEGNHIAEFNELLKAAGIEKKVIAYTDSSGDQSLYFEGIKSIPFFKTASNGTKALYSFFYWYTMANHLSLLFIDEFDAYYHYELSEYIVSLLSHQNRYQTILTSHNTNLLSTKIMRPDCYFILTPKKLCSFADATERELREGHNLEKLYQNGEFDLD